MLRPLLLLAVSVVLALHISAAVSAAQTLEDAKPSTPAFKPVAATSTYLAAAPSEITAGQTASLTVRAGRLSRCALRFHGPARVRTTRYRARVRNFGTWSWRVASKARPGMWSARISCISIRQKKRTIVTGRFVVRGDGTARGKLTKRVSFARSSRAPMTVQTDGGGRGGGGYPDDDAVDCSRRFGIYSWCKGGTWLSPRRFAYRNCTDFVAWYMGFSWGVFRGNAADWRAHAAGAGYTVVTTPAVGDIAWWDGRVAGGFGHVAVVIAVAGDGSVTIADYNGDGRGNYGVRPNKRAHAYFRPPESVRPPGATGPTGDGGTPGGGTTTGPAEPPSNRLAHELGFVRANHVSGKTEIVAYHGSPHYTTMLHNGLTGYPATDDPANVKSLALDVNGDGIDELGFVRFNHASGKTELVVFHGSPAYETLLHNGLTGYPAITDPQNVTPLAIDVNGDRIDELAFIRTNHSSGATEAVIYHGSPHYTTLLHNGPTGYPAISDPNNVTAMAIDVNGDRIDELAFVRGNHVSGKTEIVAYHGSPHYTTMLHNGLTGYPATDDPANVKSLALDVNGDGIDELGFVRFNHASGKTELVVFHGSPAYETLLHNGLTGYPAISDPQNVTPVAIQGN